jgi:hypothetical protein
MSLSDAAIIRPSDYARIRVLHVVSEAIGCWCCEGVGWVEKIESWRVSSSISTEKGPRRV